MSLEAILEAIEASGQDEIDKIREQAEQEANEILETAREEAQAIKEAERQKMLRAAHRERAHLLHDAGSQRLKIQQEGREHLIEEILEQARQRLQHFRTQQAYGEVLRHFIEEALEALIPSLPEDDVAVIEIDPRDREQIEGFLQDLPREMNLEEGADSWGGATLTSQDGRVRVINTLEARLDRATAYLYSSLSARFENHRDEDSLSDV